LIAQLIKLRTKSPETDTLQDNVFEWTQSVINQILLKGQLVSDIIVTTQTTTIAHKLGRAYQGWFIVNKNAAADVWDAGINTTDITKFLILDSTATVTIDIWVF